MLILFFFLSLIPFAAQASAAASAGIPWSLIVSQLVNFFILLVLAKLFLKKPMQLAVKDRRANFLLEEDRAKKSMGEASLLLDMWQTKWDNLSHSFNSQLEVAKTDSFQNSKASLDLVNQNIESILNKTQAQIQAELAQAKMHLAELLLEESCGEAVEEQKQQALNQSSVDLSMLKNIAGNRAFNEKA